MIFPAILLIGGIAGELFFERKKIGAEVDVTEISNGKTLREIAWYSVIALFGIFLIGYAVVLFPLSITMQLTGYTALLYSVLIAIAEEQFFRGFLTDWLLTTFQKPFIALLASAGIFCIYHFARYSTSMNALVYVLGGGFVLSWVAYKSKRVSPCMIAHSGNNLFTYLNQIVKVGVSFFR